MSAPHPTYEQLLELPAHAAQEVGGDLEDHNRHLNIRHYLAIASVGLDDSLVDLGIAPDWVDQGHSVFSAEHHLTYLGEVLVGARVSVRVRLVGRSSRAVHALAYLLDDSRERLAYVMEEIFVHIDLGQRHTAPWPDDVAAALDARVAEHARLPFAPDLCGAMALR